jgi:uncharacterized protein with GYD domain
MAVFIRLLSFTSEGSKDIKSFSKRREEFLSNIEKLNIKLIGEYVTTGSYDIVTILDAPDLNSILRLSAITAQNGKTTVETLSAVTADEFEKITQSI